MCVMSALKSASQPGGQGPGGVGARFGAGVPERANGVLADPLAQVVLEVEEVVEQTGQPGVAVLQDGVLHVGDTGAVDALRVVRGLPERRREAFDEDATVQSIGAAGADVAGEFTGAQREADHGDVTQVELGQHLVEIPGEGVPVVPDRRAAGPAESAPVVGDHAVPGGEQRMELRLPGPAVQWPPMQQDDGPAGAVVLDMELDRLRVLLTYSDGAHFKPPRVGALTR